MTQVELIRSPSVDDALRDAFRLIEQQPVPKALDALIDALVGAPGEDEGAES